MSNPNPKLTVNVDGENHELFMSYGLLTRVVNAASLGNNAGLTEGFGLDGELRDLIIMECLAKRGKYGFVVIDETFSFDNLAFTPDEAEKVFDWAMEHVTDFFMRRLEAGKQSVQPFINRLQSLMPSTDGSETSPSSTASAGPSA